MKAMIERLSSALSYDEFTGNFVWKITIGRAICGRKAGHIRADGYIQIKIDRKMYKGHILAWAIHFGEWPSMDIDHINGDKSDNRISNLRLATNSQNLGNRKLNKNSSTGLKGVHRRKDGKYRAYVNCDNVRYHIGTFTNPEQASEAYRKKSTELFGQFARSK